MLRPALILVVILAVCVAEPAVGNDVSDAEIEKLVAQLVSPNRAPEIRRPSVKYAPDYDRAAQEKVCEAWRRLRALAPRSFPFIFAHVNDKRYAMTEDAGDYLENYSVGFLCRDIIVSHLQPDVWGHKEFGTAFRNRPHGPDYVEHFRLLDPTSAQEWWQPRKNLSLRELQIEVLEWMLKEDQKPAHHLTDENRARVKKELAELKASDKPRPPDYPFAK